MRSSFHFIVTPRPGDQRFYPARIQSRGTLT